MASHAWTEADRAYLRRLSTRRDWITLAMKRFQGRTEAAVRCAMQKVRESDGLTRSHYETPWMADAVRGSQELLARLDATGLRP